MTGSDSSSLRQGIWMISFIGGDRLRLRGGRHYRARPGDRRGRPCGSARRADSLGKRNRRTISARLSGHCQASALRCPPTPSPSGRSSALCVLAVVGFFTWVTYPNYDSYYSLLWGHELLSLEQCRASRPTARRPSTRSAVVFGAALSLLGQGADRVMVLITLFTFVALAAGTYRLGRLCFTPFVGALAAFLVLTRFDFPSLAVRGLHRHPVHGRRSSGPARSRRRGRAAARSCSCCSPRRA